MGRADAKGVRMWMLMVGESTFEKMCVRMTTVILCFNAEKAHAIFPLSLPLSFYLCGLGVVAPWLGLTLLLKDNFKP